MEQSSSMPFLCSYQHPPERGAADAERRTALVVAAFSSTIRTIPLDEGQRLGEVERAAGEAAIRVGRREAPPGA